MKRQGVFFFILFSALALVVAVQPALAKKKLAQHRWKFATLAPDGVGWAKHIKGTVLPAIREATDGNMAIKTYWGGVMGDEEEYIKKMRIGQLNGAGFGGQGAVMLVPEMAVLELPFMFRNFAEVDHIKKVMGPTFDGLFRERGYALLAWVDQDFDQIHTIKTRIDTLESFEGVPFVTWYGKVEVDLLRSLKAVPVPLNVPEVAASARTGTYDGAIGPAFFVVGAQLYNLVKYINPAKIRYSPSTIVVTTKSWEDLPDEYQNKYIMLRDEVMGEYAEKVRADNERSLKAMYDYGVEKVEFAPFELDRIKKKTRKVWVENADELYPVELLEELEGYLAEFRGEKPARAPATRFASAVTRPAPKPAPAKPAPVAAQPVKTAPVRPAPAAAPAPIVVEDPLAGLSREERMEVIKQVQKVLTTYGYYNLAIDGLVGPRTFWGVKKYQRNFNLPATGQIDAMVLTHMGIKK